MVKPIAQRVEDGKLNLNMWIDKLKEVVNKENFKDPDNLNYIEQYGSAVFQFANVLVKQCKEEKEEMKQ